MVSDTAWTPKSVCNCPFNTAFCISCLGIKSFLYTLPLSILSKGVGCGAGCCCSSAARAPLPRGAGPATSTASRARRSGAPRDRRSDRRNRIFELCNIKVVESWNLRIFESSSGEDPDDDSKIRICHWNRWKSRARQGLQLPHNVLQYLISL